MPALYPRRSSNAGSTAIRPSPMRPLPAAPEVFVDGDWSQRVAAIQAGVRPLRFLAGTWTGEGSSEGEPVRGRLVASLDTGVDGDHIFLADKWRGNNGYTVRESWFNPQTEDTKPRVFPAVFR